MLIHSGLSRTPVTVMSCPEYPNKSIISKPSVVPELVQVVAREPSTVTSTVLTLVVPLYRAANVLKNRERFWNG